MLKLKLLQLQPGSNNWVSYNMANCYQFALGYREDIWCRKLMPGDFSENYKPDGYKYSDDELVELVKDDLLVLGYNLRECRQDSIIEKEEWIICILNCSKDEKEYDFHFTARFQSGGIWFQKFAGKQFAEQITSPECGTYDYHYHVVGYYKIKKVEE